MKKLLFAILAIAMLTACGTHQSNDQQASDLTVGSDTVDVFYFHGKQRCFSCNSIEELSAQVVDSLASPKIRMRVIDLTLPENQALADHFEVTWSSLILRHNDKKRDLTDMGFSYAKNKPELFKAKLTNAILQIKK